MAGMAGAAGAANVYTIVGCALMGGSDAGSGDAGLSDAGSSAPDASPGDAGLSDAGSSASDASASDAGLSADGGADAAGAFSATFDIFDSDTDQPAPGCSGQMAAATIAITGAAPLTVVANISGVVPGSVVFTYDGVEQGTHNTAPYAVAPDNAGDFEQANPPLGVGEHTLSITVYSGADAMGTVLGQATIIITVITAADAG